MSRSNKMESPDFEKIPDTIVVPAKLPAGRPTTEESRRKKIVQKAVDKNKVQGNRHHYSDKLKMDVVCSYAICGNSRRVSEMHGISEGTIRSWKTTQWWHEIMARIHQEQDDSTVSKLTGLIDKAVESVNDRLDNGDWIYDTKRGTLVRKPVSAKDLTIVTAISVDKRELLKGKPTSRVEKVSTTEHLEDLKNKFRAFSQAIEIEQVQEDEIWAEEEAANADEGFDIDETEEESEEEELTINELFGGEA